MQTIYFYLSVFIAVISLSQFVSTTTFAKQSKSKVTKNIKKIVSIPSVQIYGIENSTKNKLTWPLCADWQWHTERDNDQEYQKFSLAVWFKVENGVTLTKEGTKLNPIKPPARCPDLKGANTYLVYINSKKEDSQIQVHSSNDQIVAENLIFEMGSTNPIEQIGPLCTRTKYFIKQIETESTGAPTYIATKCMEKDTSLYMYIDTSDDTDWESISKRAKAGKGYSWKLFEFENYKNPQLSDLVLNEFTLALPEGKKAVYQIYRENDELSFGTKGISANFGLGLTQHNFKDDASQGGSLQTDLKISIEYPFGEKYLAAGNLDYNFLPLSTNNSTGFSFFSFTLDGGYNFAPSKDLTKRLSILGGIFAFRYSMTDGVFQLLQKQGIHLKFLYANWTLEKVMRWTTYLEYRYSLGSANSKGSRYDLGFSYHIGQTSYIPYFNFFAANSADKIDETSTKNTQLQGIELGVGWSL